jgi:HTH-type transcriptional regulator/antitoxin HigA
MRIRPIHNSDDHTAAVKRIERLLGAVPGSKDADELDILATLVVAYEQKHYPMPPPDPISAIRFRMGQQMLTRRDLEPLIGSRARVSEILSGKRSLTLPMVRRLSAELKIPADILVGIRAMKPPRSRGRASGRTSSPSKPARARVPAQTAAAKSR